MRTKDELFPAFIVLQGVLSGAGGT